MLFQPLRMLSDKPPQTTSTERSVAMSGRPRDIRTTCSKVTPASLESVIRENVRQDASRLTIDNGQCYSTGCEFAGVC